MLLHLHARILVFVYASLIALVQVKFQNQKQSPFETHASFMTISVIALYIGTALTLRMLFYRRNHFSRVRRVILVSVALFLTMLAPLSLIVVLFIPPQLNWIGYSIVCTLFMAIVVHNFFDYVKLIGRKMLITWEGVKEKVWH